MTAIQIVELLPSIASAVAAIVSCRVAVLVHRHSKEAEASRAEAEKSRTTTEIRRLAADIEAEAIRIELIAPQTQMAYGNLAAFSGAGGGSRQQVHQDGVDVNLREARGIVKGVRAEMESLSSRKACLSNDDLEQMQVSLWEKLQMLRVISEKLNREYADLREQILVHYQLRVGTPA